MKNKKLISKNYYIAPSKIHGKGLFTNKDFSKGELIGLAHVNDQPTPEIGMFHNHDENTPTAINIKKGNQRYLIAGGDIKAGTEITTNYRMQPELGQPEEFMTPQKDGYRSYSPFQNLPYIDINSNVIDTNNLAYDKLKLIGDNGVEKIVKNNSGNVTIPGAETVREIPLAQDGGSRKAPSRKGVRLNYDEEGNVIGESSHIMRTETLDGIHWFSFPTLFQNEDGSWLDMSEESDKDWRPALLEAKKRGELIHFGADKEEALAFGEGSWKDLDYEELELTDEEIEEYRRGGHVVEELPKAQNAGEVPTRSDSLFLLNNNKIINDLKNDGYLISNKVTYEPSENNSTQDINAFLKLKQAGIDDGSYVPMFKSDQSDIGLNNWPKQFKTIVGSRINTIKGEINKKNESKKGRFNDYWKTKGDFVGTSDWLPGGGDDLGYPIQYLHPQIAPNFQSDFYHNTSTPGGLPAPSSEKPTIYSYGYDDLAITPWDMLSDNQKKLRVNKYGVSGTPYKNIDEALLSVNKPTSYGTIKQPSYADAYKNVDKKKYPTLESFIESAENYKKYGSNTKPESKPEETKVLKSETKEKKLKKPTTKKEVIKKPEIPEGYALSKGYQRDGVSYGDMWHDTESTRPAISVGPTMDDYYSKYPKSSDIAIDDDLQKGGELPKAQYGKVLNNLFKIPNKFNPATYRQGLINAPLNVNTRKLLESQYGLRNDMYRTVNIDDKILNNEKLRESAKFAGFNPDSKIDMAAYLGVTPTGGSGRRTGYENFMNDNQDILYYGNYPMVTYNRYNDGDDKNSFVVKTKAFFDEINDLSNEEMATRIKLLDSNFSHDPSRNIFDTNKNNSLNNLPHGSIINTNSINVPNLTQTSLIFGEKYIPARDFNSVISGEDLREMFKLNNLSKYDKFKHGGDLPKAQWGKGLKTAFNSLLKIPKIPKIPTVTNLDFSNINNFTQIPPINFKSNVFPLVHKNLSDGITHTLKLSDEIGKLQSTLPSISLNNEYDLGQFKKKFLQNKGLKQEDFKILDNYILDNKLSGEIQPIDLANSIHNDLTFPVNMERIVDYGKSAESFFSTTAGRKKLSSTKLYSGYNAEEYVQSPNYSYSAYSLNTPTIKPIGDKHFGSRQKISSKSDLGSFQTSVENTIGHMRGFENLKDPTHFVVVEDQSDVMQAGTDGNNIKEVLHENYSIPHQEGINENKFLKLLQGNKNTKSKDRRWMKLQTNSIVQQLVKEGYTTIDFALGKLAAKTQGHRYTSPNEVAEYKHLNETNKKEIDELNTSIDNLRKNQTNEYPKGNVLIHKRQRLSTDIVNQHLDNEGYVLEDLYKRYKIHPQDPTYTKISDFRQYDAGINKIFNNVWRDLVVMGEPGKIGTLASKDVGKVNADKKLIKDYTTAAKEYRDWEQNFENFDIQLQDMSSNLRKIGGIKPKLSSSQIYYDGSHRKFLEKEFKHWLTETVDEFGYPILRLKVNPDLIEKVNNIKYQQGGELPKAQYGKFLSRLNKNLGTTLQNNVLKKFDINDFRNYSDDFYKNLINSSNEKLTQGLGIKKLPMNIKLEHPGKSGGLINVTMSDNNSPFIKTGELILAPVHSSHDFPNLQQRTATNILLNQKGPEIFGIPKFKVDNQSYFFSNQAGLSDSDKRLFDAYSRIPTLETHTTFDKDKFIDFGNRGLRKEWDAPFGSYDENHFYHGGNDILKGQGLSGEINEAINQSMKERGMSLFSGTTSHSTEGGDRYANLLQKGLVDPITNIPEINLHLDRLKKDPNTIENLSQYIVDNDVTFKYKKEGGEYMDLDLTEEQIQNFKDGGFVVEDLPKAQFGDLLPKFIKGITPKIPKAHQFNIGKGLGKFYGFEDNLYTTLFNMGKDPGMPDFSSYDAMGWNANLDNVDFGSIDSGDEIINIGDDLYKMSDFAFKDLNNRLKNLGYSEEDIAKHLNKSIGLRKSGELYAPKFNMLRKTTDAPSSNWFFTHGSAPHMTPGVYRGDQLKSHMNILGDIKQAKPIDLDGTLNMKLRDLSDKINVKGDFGIPGAFSGKDYLWKKFLSDNAAKIKEDTGIPDLSNDLLKQWQNKVSKTYDVLNASQKELMHKQRSIPFRKAGYEPMNKQLMQTLSGEFIENKEGGSVNKFQGGGTKKILSNILKTTLPLANKFENISIPTHPFIKDFVLNNKNLQKPMLEFLSTGITPIQNYTKTMLEELKSPEGSKRLFKQESEYMRKIGMSEEYIDRAANLAVNARLKELEVMGMKNNSAVKAKNLLSIGDPKEIENFLSNRYLYSNASYSPAIESVIDSWDPRYFKDRFGIASKKDTDAIRKEAFTLDTTRLGIYNLPGSINIGADWNFPFSTPILAHELRGHGLQSGRKLKIDSDAIKLIKPKKELNESQQEAYDYFKKSGKEPSAFLNELREAMLSNGLIKKRYEYITPQKLKIASIFFKRKPMGIVKSNNRKHFSSNTRILDFMDETPKMFMNLSSLLNRLPSVAGAIGTGAALYNNEEVDTDRPEWNFKKGGSVPTFQDGGNNNKGYYYIDPKTKERVWVKNIKNPSDRGYYDNKGLWHDQPLILSQFKNEEEFKAAEEFVEKDTQRSNLESSVEFKNEQALKKFKKNYPKKYKNYIANKKSLQKNTNPDKLNAKRTNEIGTYKDKSVNIYEGSFDDAYNLARYHAGENLLSEDSKDVFGWKNPNTGEIEYKHIYSAGETGEWSDGTPYVPGYSKEFLDTHPEFVKQVKEYRNFSDEELKKYNIDTEESQKKREEVETFMKDKPEFAQYFKNKKALKDNPDLFNEEEKYDIDQQNEEVYQNAYKEHYSNVTGFETRKKTLDDAKKVYNDPSNVKNINSYNSYASQEQPLGMSETTQMFSGPENIHGFIMPPDPNQNVTMNDIHNSGYSNADENTYSNYFTIPQLKNILKDDHSEVRQMSYMSPDKIDLLNKLEKEYKQDQKYLPNKRKMSEKDIKKLNELKDEKKLIDNNTIGLSDNDKELIKGIDESMGQIPFQNKIMLDYYKKNLLPEDYDNLVRGGLDNMASVMETEFKPMIDNMHKERVENYKDAQDVGVMDYIDFAVSDPFRNLLGMNVSDTYRNKSLGERARAYKMANAMDNLDEVRGDTWGMATALNAGYWFGPTSRLPMANLAAQGLYDIGTEHIPNLYNEGTTNWGDLGMDAVSVALGRFRKGAKPLIKSLSNPNSVQRIIPRGKKFIPNLSPGKGEFYQPGQYIKPKDQSLFASGVSNTEGSYFRLPGNRTILTGRPSMNHYEHMYPTWGNKYFGGYKYGPASSPWKPTILDPNKNPGLGYEHGGEYKELELTDSQIKKLEQDGYEIEYM